MFRYLLSLIIAGTFLISCGGGGGSGDSNPPPVIKTAPKVGLAILGLLNAGFPVDEAIDLLSVSSRPTFSFIHKTFGENPQNYITLVDNLRSQGKSPHVGIYAICGPCRPPRRDGSLVKFRPDLNVSELNRLLANDARVQEDFRNYLIDLRQNIVMLYNDLEYDIYPELESNMDFNAQQKALEIAREVFSGMSNVRIVINPVSNNRHPGAPLEIHTDWAGNLPLVGAGEAISMDGQLLNFRDEAGLRGPSFEETKKFVSDAVAKGVIFYLWRHEWQGLNREGRRPPAPDNRTYKFTRKDEIKELLLLE